ncbi:tRNA1(Val) (adenine(37)-N6)-methyltransferase [Thetidibacter halocola]|uniref:tRNA1(Val) (adenine(37)-N6)-methyltransferase n=1 Tax=Thetidibacter halocola TaxID=2827239 RepID=UPI003D161FC1
MTLTQDHFLGGRVRLWQPVAGYRAGVDPVLLAAACAARSGQAVLELGCGAGAALCCLGARVGGLRLDGLEIQPDYAALARRNLSENALTGTVFEGDVAVPPAAVRQVSYDHVIANPPYFEASKGLAAQDAGRDTGRAGAVPLADWLGLAARRLKPGGFATVIQRVERLPELMAAFDAVLGSLELMPLIPREGRGPRLILLRGRKDGRAPFRFHPGPIMHPGAAHGFDGEGYTLLFEAIFRDAASLPFPE